MAVDRSYIGKQSDPVTMRVELGKIREFARAIKDDDPLYFDEQDPGIPAQGVWAPLTFLQTVRFWDDDGAKTIRPPFDLKRVLHGEQEYEYFGPVTAGDTLTAVSRIVDLYEKPGKRGGTMTFCVTETDFTNQRGELVARARQVGIETGQVVKD